MLNDLRGLEGGYQGREVRMAREEMIADEMRNGLEDSKGESG